MRWIQSTGGPLRQRLALGIVVLSSACLVGLLLSRWMPRRRVETPVYHGEPIVNAVALSLDRNAKYAAAALSDGRLRVWETESRIELPVQLPSRLSLNDLSWTDEGSILTGGFEQTLLAWNVKSGRATKLPGFHFQITSIAARPLQPEILVALSNGQLFLIDPKTQKRISLTTGHQGIVKVVRFFQKGNQFLTGGADGQLVWHNWATREVTQKVAAHANELSCLAISEDGRKIVTGSWDRTAKLWDANSFELLATFQHDMEVAQVAWMGDDVVTSSWDEQLRFWSSQSAILMDVVPWNHDSMAFAVIPGRREVIGLDAAGKWYTAKP